MNKKPCDYTPDQYEDTFKPVRLVFNFLKPPFYMLVIGFPLALALNHVSGGALEDLHRHSSGGGDQHCDLFACSN